MGNARDLSAETMSTTLSNTRHEAFALHIANGHKLQHAHELGGFKPDRKTAWSLRHLIGERSIREIVEAGVEVRARTPSRTAITEW